MNRITTDVQRTTGTPDAVKARKPRKVAKRKASGRKATPRKTATKRKAAKGGGKALPDFTNEAKIKVVKGRDIARKGCFRSGQTVAQCLAAQKRAGYRGRRKYIRKQVALKRITLS